MYYESDYSINLCKDYMKHSNVNDVFLYNWEEKEDHFLITFTEYKKGILSLANAPKPCFKVMFEDLDIKTGIKVEFIEDFLQPVPFVYTKDIDEFWKEKLNAVKQKD